MSLLTSFKKKDTSISMAKDDKVHGRSKNKINIKKQGGVV